MFSVLLLCSRNIAIEEITILGIIYVALYIAEYRIGLMPVGAYCGK
jgi:hypothetical protein